MNLSYLGTKTVRISASVLVALALGPCGFLLPAGADGPNIPAEAKPAGVLPASRAAASPGAPLSYYQLSRLLMDFADRYTQMIGQAADALQRKNTDPGARAAIHSMKLFPCSAVFSIAVDPNPRTALLDMAILAHLQGSVWRESVPKRFGNAASTLLGLHQMLEDDIDAITLKVIGPDKLEKLKALVDQWRKEHPGQYYVSYIRLSDITQMRQENPRPSSPNLLSVAGFLSTFQLINIDETTRSVDEARMVAERAIYLSQRMPNLIRWQSTMFFYEMFGTPEGKNMTSAFRAFETLPADIRRELHGAIWEAAAALLVVALAVFCLALVYRFLVRKL